MTPDFTAEARAVAFRIGAIHELDPLVALLRRTFAQGMRYVRDEADLEAYGAACVEEEATLIENGGNP